MSRIVLASNNAKKLVELRRTFEGADTEVEIVGLSEVSDAPAPEETGRTFVENALIKARAAAHETLLFLLQMGCRVGMLPINLLKTAGIQ